MYFLSIKQNLRDFFLKSMLYLQLSISLSFIFCYYFGLCCFFCYKMARVSSMHDLIGRETFSLNIFSGYDEEQMTAFHLLSIIISSELFNPNSTLDISRHFQIGFLCAVLLIRTALPQNWHTDPTQRLAWMVLEESQFFV